MAQGTPQFIVIRFASLVDVQSVTIMFQGGFVGKVCSFRGGRSADRKLEDIAMYEPADTNDLQVHIGLVLLLLLLLLQLPRDCWLLTLQIHSEQTGV